MHLRQGEACKDKMCDGKTPRSVSQRGVRRVSQRGGRLLFIVSQRGVLLRTVLVNFGFTKII